MLWFTSWGRWLKLQSQTVQRSRQASARTKSYHRLRLEPLEERLAPANHTWRGAASNLWSNDANWEGRAPTAGESNVILFFLGGAANLTNTNDIAGLTIQSIVFSANGYSVSGSAITLTMGLTADAGVTATDTFNLDTALGAAQPWTVSNAGATLAVGGNVSGAAALTKAGAGALTLGATNTYTGGTTLISGTLAVGGNSPVGTGILALNGGTLASINLGPQTLRNDFTVGGPATVGSVNDVLTFTGQGALVAGNTLTVANKTGTIAFSGILMGGGALTKAAAGTLVLSGANTYAGDTTINGGALHLGAANAIPSASAVMVAAGATLNLNNFDDTIASLAGAGSVTLGNGTLTTGGDNTSTTFSGVISGTGGRLIKAGTGTFILSATNTYTGGTTINGGALHVGAANAIPSASAVIVAAGATLNLKMFDETIASLAGAGSVILGTGTLTVNGTNSSVFSGDLSGTGGLTKIGTGTLTLSGASTYTGNSTLTSGTLVVGNDKALGTGTLVLNGGTLQSSAAVTLSNPFSVNVVGSAITVDGSNNLTFTGTGTLNAGTTLTVSNTATTTFSGFLSGAGNLIEAANAGTFVLSGSNAYTGTTTLTSGTLTVGNNTALGTTGTLALNGGTLQSSAAVTLANPFSVGGPGTVGGSNNLTLTGAGTLNVSTLTVSNTGTTTFSGFLSGAGGLIEAANAGTFVLSGINAYTGSTTLLGGTLTVGNNTALGTGTLFLNGGTLQSSAAVTLANPFSVNAAVTVAGSNNLTLTGAGRLNFTNTLTVSNTGTTTFSGVLSGMGNLTEAAGTGTVVLSGANTYTGTTTVRPGILIVDNSAALGGSMLILDGGMVQYTAGGTVTTPLTVNMPTTMGGNTDLTFSGPVTLNSTLTIVAGTAGTVITFTGQISGGGKLIKVGAGKLVLSTDNTYTGPTEVDAGTLLVKGRQPRSDVLVMAGATLGGTGTVGAVTVKGGTLRPGGSPGVLTTSGNVTLDGMSSFVVALDGTTPGTTGHSQLNAGGSVNLGGSMLMGTAGFTPTPGSTFVITQSTGTVTGTFKNLFEGAVFNFGQPAFGIHYETNRVVLISEAPATAANLRFVIQLYRDLLRRVPDGGGLMAFAALLGQNTATRFQVVTGIATSQEFRMLEVQDVYHGFLKRDADSIGLAGWTQFLIRGGTMEQLEAFIVASPEYFQARGGGARDRFLDVLYQDTFNRAVDDGARRAFSNLDFGDAGLRLRFAEAIFSSAEFRQDLVQAFFQRFLNRSADPGGLSAFMAALANGVSDETLSAVIVSSPEYFSRANP